MLPGNINDPNYCTELDNHKNLLQEGLMLEFKREINLKGEDGKRKFLSELTAFANQMGGDLVYGLEEGNTPGCFENIIGIEVLQKDNFRLRAENLMRDAISPRLKNVQIVFIPLVGQVNRYVVVFRVKKSVVAPHRIEVGKIKRFYGRNSGGKYELSVDELRQSFVMAGTMKSQVRDSRADLLIKLTSEEGYGDYHYNPFLSIQVIPYGALTGETKLDVKKVWASRDRRLAPPMQARFSGTKYNFDGLLIYQKSEELSAQLQVNHSGILEGVTSNFFRKTHEGLFVHMVALQNTLNSTVLDYLNFLKDNTDSVFPAFINIDLINVKGLLPQDQPLRLEVKMQHNFHPVDRDRLSIETIIIEEFDGDVKEMGELLRPVFDRLWNAIGASEAPYYDKDGRWILDEIR